MKYIYNGYYGKILLLPLFNCKDGGSYVNSDCSTICLCSENRLTCETYACSANATCRAIDGVNACQCREGFDGNGLHCSAIATDCLDLYEAGERTSGVYTIHPTGWSGSSFEVYCEMDSNGGGWTVREGESNP